MSTTNQYKEEDAPIAVRVTSQPVQSAPTVYAQPYVAQTNYSPYSEDQRRAAASSYYVIIPFRGNEFDEKMLMVSALARSMKLLAMFDLFLLLLLAIFNLFFLLGVWGPICGYYGSKQFKKSLIYVYAAYWLIRSVIDMVLILSGYWWFILSLIVDIYISSYIWTFARALGELTDAELNRLQSPHEETLLVTSA